MERLRHQDSLLFLLIAVFIGSFFEVLPLYALLKSYSDALAVGSTPYVPLTWYHIAWIVVWPLVYCILASLFPRPKRIVSPVFIQGIAFSFGASFILYSSTQFSFGGISPWYATPSNILSVAAYFGLFAMGFFTIGFYQLFAVRVVVGLDFEGINQRTYRVNIPANDIAEVLLDKKSEQTRFFKVIPDEDDLLILRRWYRGGDVVVIGLMPDKDFKQTASVLTFLAYSDALNSIRTSLAAERTRDFLVDSIKGRFLKEGIEMNEVKEPKDLLSTRAFAVASNPSRSRLSIVKEVFNGLQLYYRVATVLTATFMVGLTIADAYGIAKFDYVGVIALLFVALVAEIGLAGAEEYRRRRSSRPEWLTST